MYAWLLRNVLPVGFPDHAAEGAIDVLLADGRVAAVGASLAMPDGAQVIEGKGAFVSPGWTDLHAHVWHGGTDISLRPEMCGLKRGVTTIVDAGSAGEANFHGFREFIMEPARERILAFLNIGSIGLVACNRVSELMDHRSINFDRIVATVEANRDRIVGLKVRASHVILGSWGITPVKLAKKLGRILKLPLMVHVGEPPPLYDEVLEVLGEGDIVTHCFNGKAGSSLLEDEDLFALVEGCAARGIHLDVGHGGASYSMKVAEAAIARGVLPDTISTDLHLRSIERPVWDMATTMSKLLAAGMPFARVVEAVTTAPARVLRRPIAGSLAPGAEANFTIFERVAQTQKVIDSNGDTAVLPEVIEPRHAILGTHVVAASRYVPTAMACPTCGTAHAFPRRA
jgi:dihydroorotase